MNEVYTPLENPPSSRFFYFYYLTDDSDKYTRTYYTRRDHRVPHDEVPSEIVEILEERRRGELVSRGDELGDLNWCHKSYIVIVWDPSHGGKLEDGNAMTFSLKADQPGQVEGGNHSFRAGRDFNGLPEPYDRLGVFYCFNQMKNKDGQVLGNMETERFLVKVNHGRFRAHEDTATNLGPPRPQ